MFKKKFDTVKFTNARAEELSSKLIFGGAIAVLIGLAWDGIHSDIFHNTAEKENHSTTELHEFFNDNADEKNPGAYISLHE